MGQKIIQYTIYKEVYNVDKLFPILLDKFGQNIQVHVNPYHDFLFGILASFLKYTHETNSYGPSHKYQTICEYVCILIIDSNVTFRHSDLDYWGGAHR